MIDTIGMRMRNLEHTALVHREVISPDVACKLVGQGNVVTHLIKVDAEQVVGDAEGNQVVGDELVDGVVLALEVTGSSIGIGLLALLLELGVNLVPVGDDVTVHDRSRYAPVGLVDAVGLNKSRVAVVAVRRADTLGVVVGFVTQLAHIDVGQILIDLIAVELHGVGPACLGEQAGEDMQIVCRGHQ